MTRTDKGGKEVSVRITEVTILLDSSDSRSGVLYVAILNVVGLGVNFCSDSSFHTLGSVKYDIFLMCSVLA